MQFTKIKYNTTENRTTIHLRWETELDNGATEKQMLESDDAARQSFFEALGALRPHFAEILELPDAYGQDAEIRGVTITREQGRIKSATISAVKYLQAGAASINTPHTEALSFECLEAIRELEREAEGYAEGRRAQIGLFDEFDQKMQRAADRMGPGASITVGVEGGSAHSWEAASVE